MAGAPSDNLAVRPFDRVHERQSFTCGVASLDNYLKSQAGQDARRRASGVFVLVDPALPAQVLGYYTLAALSLAQGDVPEGVRRRAPRYPQVSATLIGRLAVAQARQGQGLGPVLLLDAMRRAYASAATVGSSMIVVDAIDDRAAAFYQAFGFLSFPEASRLMFPMHLVAQLPNQ
jgi:GNAT superfamily N-acetyltransferase